MWTVQWIGGGLRGPAPVTDRSSSTTPNNALFIMRQSALPGRQSQLAAAQHLSTSAASAKLLEKKKEYYAVAALERASTLFLERIEGLGEDCEVMADSGEGSLLARRSKAQSDALKVLGQVLAQWPKMFEILSQFSKSFIHCAWII